MATKFGTALVKGKNGLEVGKEAARKAQEKAGITKPDFCIVFASSEYDYAEVIKGIGQVINDAPLIGCSSSGEFTEESVEKGSVACAVISSDTHKFFTGFGTGLKEDTVKCLKDTVSGFPSDVKGYPYRSSIMLIDGLARKGEESVLSALMALSPNVKFSGGAAGDDLKFKETYVFSNEKIATDAVVAALLTSKIPVAIGVKHGHSPISPPLTVTKAEGCTVYEIDGKPAFDVWKHYTRENAKQLGIDVDKMGVTEAIQNFFTRYEAGLLTGGTDYKIRWLGGTTTTEGPITFLCATPEGTVLRVMESPKQAQISSARKAAEIALSSSQGVELAGAIIFDCVCRAIILGNEFSKAVAGITDVLSGIPLVGFETYGEIAMEIGQLSGFHNTTTVVLLIPA